MSKQELVNTFSHLTFEINMFSCSMMPSCIRLRVWRCKQNVQSCFSHRLSLLITQTCSSECKVKTNEYLLEKNYGYIHRIYFRFTIFPYHKKNLVNSFLLFLSIIYSSSKRTLIYYGKTMLLHQTLWNFDLLWSYVENQGFFQRIWIYYEKSIHNERYFYLKLTYLYVCDN